jgi:hypothetical protein
MRRYFNIFTRSYICTSRLTLNFKNKSTGAVFGWIQFRKFSMKKFIRKYSLAIAAVSVAVLAMPAQAVQVSFSGSGLTDAATITGVDPLANTWAITNGPAGTNSRFTMADSVETAQTFNLANFSNGLGSFANSFKLTTNSSQQAAGFKGISTAPGATTLVNEFMVKDVANDDASWYSWIVSYGAPDNNFFQRITFTAPIGKQLSQGQDFKMNVNFAGIITSDTGYAASWDDRLAPIPTDIPEPGSLALMGLGVAGLIGMKRRNKKA